MMYFLFNNDGSIKFLKVGESIQQGSHGVNFVFCAIEGYDNDNYVADALFTLPNGELSEGVAIADTQEIDGTFYNGFLIELTEAQLLLAGNLLFNLRLKDLNNLVLATYEYTFKINPTSYLPDETKITEAQYQLLLQSFNSFQIKYAKANVRFYESRELANEDVVNLAEGQNVFILINNKVVPFKKQNGVLVQLGFAEIGVIEYTAGQGILINDYEISVNTSVIATNESVDEKINLKLTNLYKIRGNSTTSILNGLTKTAELNGYVYNITSGNELDNYDGTSTMVIPGDNVVFIWNNGDWRWDKLAGDIDFSRFATKSELTSGLANKVSISTGTSGIFRLYGFNGATQNTYIAAHNLSTGSGTIMKRNSQNRAEIATPVNDNEIANKKYVDDSVSPKANANEVTPKPTVNPNYKTISVQKEDGTFETFIATDNQNIVNSLIQRNESGYARVLDPVGNADIANKYYVDNHHDATKQDALTAGTGISIADNVISANVDLTGCVQVNSPNYVNNATQVYGKDQNNNQYMFTIAQGSATGNSIVRRTAGGQIYTGAPTADNHATTKKYVDDQIANMNGAIVGYATLDKSKLGYSTDGNTRPTQRTYTAISSGNDAYLTYEKIGSILRVTIKYVKGDSVLVTDSSIRISYADILSAISISGTVNSAYTSVNGCSVRDSTVYGTSSLVTCSDSSYIYLADDGYDHEGFDVTVTLVVS